MIKTINLPLAILVALVTLLGQPLWAQTTATPTTITPTAPNLQAQHLEVEDQTTVRSYGMTPTFKISPKAPSSLEEIMKNTYTVVVAEQEEDIATYLVGSGDPRSNFGGRQVKVTYLTPIPEGLRGLGSQNRAVKLMPFQVISALHSGQRYAYALFETSSSGGKSTMKRVSPIYTCTTGPKAPIQEPLIKDFQVMPGAVDIEFVADLLQYNPDPVLERGILYGPTAEAAKLGKNKVLTGIYGTTSNFNFKVSARMFEVGNLKNGITFLPFITTSIDGDVKTVYGTPVSIKSLNGVESGQVSLKVLAQDTAARLTLEVSGRLSVEDGSYVVTIYEDVKGDETKKSLMEKAITWSSPTLGDVAISGLNAEKSYIAEVSIVGGGWRKSLKTVSFKTLRGVEQTQAVNLVQYQSALVPRQYQATVHQPKGTARGTLTVALPPRYSNMEIIASLGNAAGVKPQTLLNTSGRVSFTFDTRGLPVGAYYLDLKGRPTGAGGMEPLKINYSSALIVTNPSHNYGTRARVMEYIGSGQGGQSIFCIEIEGLTPKLNLKDFKVSASYDGGAMKPVVVQPVESRDPRNSAATNTRYAFSVKEVPAKFKKVTYQVTYKGQPIYSAYNPSLALASSIHYNRLAPVTIEYLRPGVMCGFYNSAQSSGTEKEGYRAKFFESYFELSILEGEPSVEVVNVEGNIDYNLSEWTQRPLDRGDLRMDFQLRKGDLEVYSQYDLILSTGLNVNPSQSVRFLTVQDLENNGPLYNFFQRYHGRALLNVSSNSYSTILDMASRFLGGSAYMVDLQTVTTLNGIQSVCPSLANLKVRDASNLANIDAVGRLKELRTLDVAGNNLKALPDLRGLKLMVKDGSYETSFEGNAIPAEFFTAKYLPQSLLSDKAWLERNIRSQR